MPVATSPPVSSVAPSSLPIPVYEWIFSSAALVDHRADVGVVLPARPEAQLLGRGDELRLELAVDLLVDDHAARRGAALAGGAERRPDDPVGGEVEVGVVHDDDRVLAAELEVDALEVVRAAFACTATPVSREPVSVITGTSG